ncbi:MAG: asparagine--tRNA ligase [Candidatus Falkowbacteria bacterium]
MKGLFINSLSDQKLIGQKLEVLGWVTGKRMHKKTIFLDVCDSTGVVQVVINRDLVSQNCFSLSSALRIESAVSIFGVLTPSAKDGSLEVIVSDVTLIGNVDIEISPSPHSDIDIFDESLTDNLLRYRHLYIRNPKVMAILRFRNLLKNILQGWFEQNGYTEIDAPILVPAPLYDGSTAIGVKIRKEDVYLSQCAGFYLEASVHAFEKVYNMGPSFRGEESRSKRHLIEYWHIKAELAWGDREDIIRIVEDVISYVTKELEKKSKDLISIIGKELTLSGLNVPFPRLDYRDAINLLKDGGFDIDFGVGLGSEEEEFLSKNYDSPFWIVGIPRKIEPFPYCIDQNDTELTMVADLIANNGYGELLGVAEKISDFVMLKERMSEKNKENDPIYGFVKDVHQFGSVPHIAFGMGLERLMRWLLNIPHVRDCIPYPRVVRRNIMP